VYRYIGDVKALIDDGAVVYLNGAEIGRVNMKAGVAITGSTLALVNIQGTAQLTLRTLTIPDSAIRDGANTFAVEVILVDPDPSSALA
jgi:hypothetical protein